LISALHRSWALDLDQWLNKGPLARPASRIRRAIGINIGAAVLLVLEQ
jgi:hypothetical protein